MITKASTWIVAVALAALYASYPAWAADDADEADLIKAMGGAKITLQQGMTAGDQAGKPISAKFEVEDGKLQLSVYAAKGGKYFEVVVDPVTGKVAKTEPITDADDLAQAKAQDAVMAKAKETLKAAVDKAVTGSGAGSRAVSATPEAENGAPVVSIGLLKGGKLQTVTQKLN